MGVEGQFSEVGARMGREPSNLEHFWARRRVRLGATPVIPGKENEGPRCSEAAIP
jgi:hypothetical protein